MKFETIRALPRSSLLAKLSNRRRDDHDTDGHSQGRAESVRVLALRSSVIHGFVTEP